MQKQRSRCGVQHTSPNDPAGFILLETARLILRDHRFSDMSTHHALLSDPEAMRYLPDIRTHSPAGSEENLSASMSEIGREDRARYFLRIKEKETGRHIGEIGYTVTDFTPVGKVVHLGYFTYPRCWNHGYTTEALKEVLRFAFEQNNVFRVCTGCLKENAASERVMQKCGMAREAECVQRQWHEGKMKDRVEYRMLRDEWFALRR
jgi:ribosomal-protein-alanine N-acetyltransferase